MIPFHLDFESRSRAVLKGPLGVGAARYAMDPSTDILCMSYSIGNSPTKILKRPVFLERPGIYPKFPEELRPYIDNPEYIFTAHNAFFEECIWEYVLHRRYGWPRLMNPKKWACTLAKAAMCNLPLDLDSLGAVLQIKERKKAVRGAELISILCKPQGYDPLGDPIWNEDPALMEEFYDYNMTDVDAEKEVDGRLPELPEFERRLWELDFIINHRGIKADVQAARQATKMAAALTERMNVQMLAKSGGMVEKVSQPKRVCQWMKEKHGIDSDGLDKAQLAALLRRTDLPLIVREVLYLRSQGGKSSTSKYAKILATASPVDGRIRGNLQYHGAGTGRWSGRQVQFQNLPKGSEKKPEAAIEIIKSGDTEWFEVCYPKPMETLSSCIRGIALTADEGHDLLCADYAGIEVAVLMWEAGETEALKKLAAGQSLYPGMADYIYGLADGTVKKGDPNFASQYAVGKATVLGAGYSMWWPRFMEECLKQGISLGSNKITGEVTFADEDDVEIEAKLYQEEWAKWTSRGPGAEEVFKAWWKANGRGASMARYVPLKKKRFMTEAEVMYKNAIVAFRNKYPRVPALWKEMEQAAKMAVKNPGQIYPVSKVRWGMDRKREFLLCQLPSGRCLRYFHPFIKAKTTKWGEVREQLHFWGEDSQTKQWGIQHTYGGKLVENVTQAIARDVMGNGMLNCEAAGFPLVLTVHDELIAEILATRRWYRMAGFVCGRPGCEMIKEEVKPLDEFIRQMCNLPPWADGMPIRAEGWVGKRYKK